MRAEEGFNIVIEGLHHVCTAQQATVHSLHVQALVILSCATATQVNDVQSSSFPYILKSTVLAESTRSIHTRKQTHTSTSVPVLLIQGRVRNRGVCMNRQVCSAVAPNRTKYSSSKGRHDPHKYFQWGKSPRQKHPKGACCHCQVQAYTRPAILLTSHHHQPRLRTSEHTCTSLETVLTASKRSALFGARLHVMS